MSAMIEAQRRTNECGQTINVFPSNECHMAVPTIIHQLCTMTMKLLVVIELVITGKYPTQVKVWANSTLQREYLKTIHEEADVVVIVVVCVS